MDSRLNPDSGEKATPTPVSQGAEPNWYVLLRVVLLLVPIALLIPLLWLKLTDPWRYWHFAGREDGTIEWATAATYLTAAPIALWLANSFRARRLLLHALLSLLFALAMFFIGMEEISWGQRVLGLETPIALAEINRQAELNLHNIGDNKTWLLSIYALVSGIGFSAWFWLPTVLAVLGQGRWDSLVSLLAPPRFLTLFFFVPFLLYSYYIVSPFVAEVLGDQWAVDDHPGGTRFLFSRDQEPVEFILSLGFLLHAFWLSILMLSEHWPGDRASHSDY